MKSIDSIKIYIDLCGTSKDLVSEKKKKGKYNKNIQK